MSATAFPFWAFLARRRFWLLWNRLWIEALLVLAALLLDRTRGGVLRRRAAGGPWLSCCCRSLSGLRVRRCAWRLCAGAAGKIAGVVDRIRQSDDAEVRFRV
jgi:hypothetical protein